MTTIKSFTDLEQSKKLAKILPLKSADAFYPWRELMKDYDSIYVPEKMLMSDLAEDDIPCWSLAALLGVLPVIIGNVLSKNALRLRIDKSETDFNIWYENIDTAMVEEGFDIIKTNPIDACVEMIEKLHKLNLL